MPPKVKTVAKAQILSSLDAVIAGQEKKYKYGDFELIKKLWSGKFSEVWLAIYRCEEKEVGVKIINMTFIEKYQLTKELENEVNILTMLKHPNIIKLYGLFKHYNKLYLIMQYHEKGSLHDDMKRQELMMYNEKAAAKYVSQVASALVACHEAGYIHGDVKPENILITENDDAILTDFGLSWRIGEDTSNRGDSGTVQYMAPEVIKASIYGPAMDGWSLGVVCYTMLSGMHPFESNTVEEVISKIAFMEEIQYPNTIKPAARKFIDKFLQVPVCERITLKNIPNEEWIKNLCGNHE